MNAIKILIPIYVPDSNCLLCIKAYNTVDGFLVCTAFSNTTLEELNGKYQRCQACFDATVKE